MPDDPRTRSHFLALARFVRGVRRGSGVSDQAFDSLVAGRWRRAGRRHWTPCEVCLRVAALLDLRPEERALDVGSGLGKLCLIGALATPGQFVGVEQRLPLVRAARRLARELKLKNATFLHEDALAVDWRPYDALYFFNPFAELELGKAARIDHSIEWGPRRLALSRRRTRWQLGRMRPGTRVVVFYDLGLELPQGYLLRRREWIRGHALELWLKR